MITDFKSNKLLLHQFSNVLNDINNISDDSIVSKYRKNLTNIANCVWRQSMLRELSHIDITYLKQLNKRVRVNALRAAGKEYISDLLGIDRNKLMQISGIGKNQSELISSSVNDAVSIVEQTMTIKINQVTATKEISDLVTKLIQYEKSLEIVKKSQGLVNEYQKDINSMMIDAKPATSRVRWYLSSKGRHDTSLEALGKLEEIDLDLLKKNINFFKQERKWLYSLTIDQAWSIYNSNPGHYLDFLGEIFPKFKGNDFDEELDQEIVKQISDLNLNLAGFKFELRKYQELGVKYILNQGKVLLGDEMGLGKTIQAIAAIKHLDNNVGGKFLIICPASVLENWYREIEVSSDLRVFVLHGQTFYHQFNDWKQNGGVAITTFGMTKNLLDLGKLRLTLLVVDEAQYIKNPSALRTKNVRKLTEKSQRILFMTGTPLENKVEEMVNLIQMLQPEIADKLKNVNNVAQSEWFKRTIAPVYYRRRRDDVLAELPPLVEINEWCTLNSDEADLYYQTLRNRNYMQIRQVSWNVENINHSSKATRMLELIKLANDDHRKVIIFSFFLEPLERIRKLLGNKSTEIINGSLSPKQRQQIIDEFERDNNKTVLVSQIQAGGVGLNIQSASVVIICEPQFKPSTEVQAISRAYRMGQTRDVVVYRLLAKNTIDERMMELIDYKQSLFDAFADESEVNNKVQQSVNRLKFRELVEEELAKAK